jgi:hypothetical protein
MRPQDWSWSSVATISTQLACREVAN